MSPENIIETDVLVIGGGLSGLTAAIKAKEKGVDVVLVDKGYVGKAGASPSATRFLVFNPEWGHDLVAWRDQVSFIGEYMNNIEWTDIVLKESYQSYLDLVSWGMNFLRNDKGEFVLAPIRSPDQPELEKFPMYALSHWRRSEPYALRQYAVKVGVKIVDKIYINDLIKQDGQVVGAIGTTCVVDRYDSYVFKAKATIMAAGTAALKPDGIVLHNLTGDAEAMAYRIGCEITGKEWNEHWSKSAEFPGARCNHLPQDVSWMQPGDESRIMWMYNAEGNMICRPETLKWGNPSLDEEIVEAHAGRAPVFNDRGGDKKIRRKVLPGWADRDRPPAGLRRKMIDIEADKLFRRRSVIGGGFGMSNHMSEGIWPVGTTCATQVPGLFAAGDSLGARVSGAEYATMGYAGAAAAVTGARAGNAAGDYASQIKEQKLNMDEVARLKKLMYTSTERKGGFTPGWTTQTLRAILMPYWILYYKNEERLKAALTNIEFMRDNIVPKLTAESPHELRLALETKNMVLSAEMKVRASIMRKESRGNHLREDYPRRNDPEWLAWIKIKDDNGQMKLTKEPIPKEWWPDPSIPYNKKYPMAWE